LQRSVARRISIRIQLNSNFLLIGIFARRAFKLIARPDVRDRLRTQRKVKSCAKEPRKGPELFSCSFFIRFRTHPFPDTPDFLFLDLFSLLAATRSFLFVPYCDVKLHYTRHQSCFPWWSKRTISPSNAAPRMLVSSRGFDLGSRKLNTIGRSSGFDLNGIMSRSHDTSELISWKSLSQSRAVESLVSDASAARVQTFPYHFWKIFLMLTCAMAII